MLRWLGVSVALLACGLWCVAQAASPPVKLLLLQKTPFIGLLDQLTANASCAYSTRKLRAAYAGKALNVRRTSDGATQDIGFTSSGNLDQVSLAAFVGSNGGYVTKWYDQSGNGCNATQATTTLQPQLVAAGAINVRNKQACMLTGIGSGAGTDTWLGFGPTIAQPFVINFVFQYDTIVAGAHLMDGSSSRVLFGYGGATTYQFYLGSSAEITGTTDTTTVHGIFAVANNTASGFYVDNVLQSSLTNSLGTNGIAATEWIGQATGAAGVNAWICEYIVFPSIPGTTDRGTLHTSQSAYWGTP